MRKDMYSDIVAVCPRCGQRSRIVSHQWDWDHETDYVTIRCMNGHKSVIPYLESRVVDVDLRNPYMREEHFKVLIPFTKDGDTWEKISKCLTASWNTF